MKLKQIVCVALTAIFLLMSSTAYASTNWESGDAAGLAEALNGDNLWRIRDKNNKSIFDAEGLRVTVYDAQSGKNLFHTLDITGNSRISDVTQMRYFADGNGFIPKTTWLLSSYVGTTYNAIDEQSKQKFFNVVSGKIQRRGYSSSYIPELSSVKIISENNTSNLEAIRQLIGDEFFLRNFCDLVDGMEYEDFEKGKYKIAFEPIAYMTVAGEQWVLSSTECSILDRYMLDILGKPFNNGPIKDLMGPLTHSQMPLAAFLSEKDLGINSLDLSALRSGTDFTYSMRGERRYNNSCIIRSMGIGVLSALGSGDDTENTDISTVVAEYHTDTDVYTSFNFVNQSGTDIISGGKFSIYDASGNPPRSYYGPLSERDEDGIYKTNEVGDKYLNVTEDTKIDVYIENPKYAEKEAQGIYWGVPPYIRLGSYKDGDFIKGTSEELSYTVKSASKTIASGTLSFSCPNGEEAMGWFEWHTPKTAQEVTITISSERDGVYILDTNGNKHQTLTVKANVDKVKENTPPDPTALDKRPSWQSSYSESAVQNNISQYAPIDGEQTLTWYVWTYAYDWYQSCWDNGSGNYSTFKYRDNYGRIQEELYYRYYYGVDNDYYYNKTAYENGKLNKNKKMNAVIIGGTPKKVEYSVSLSADMKISPSSHCPTATYSNATGEYTMKSGYGIQITINTHLRGDTELCTGSQKANVLFPEFNYNMQSSALYNRVLDKDGRTFVFKQNEFSTYNDRVHFTPIWYPDGKYTVYAEVFDVWCPAGQLSVRLTDQMNIRGNVYDDWHVAPDNP